MLTDAIIQINFIDTLIKEGVKERAVQGQKTLGYLKEALESILPDTACQYDTGENFGLSPVSYVLNPPFTSSIYSRGAYWEAHSETAYPSCYRGFYSDCTFNASKFYPLSTVSHVLNMVNGTIDKAFDGYKGGVNLFDEDTLVWGGSTSFESLGGSRMLVGVDLVDDVCILKTKEYLI